jgi:chemotaxis protein MotB
LNKQREVPIRIIVRKKLQVSAHHGGAWKVAFADFMTAMFALFLVLWLVTQSTDIRSAVAGYFQDPLGRANEFGSSIMPGQGAQTSAPPHPLTPPQVLDMRRTRLRQVAKQLEERLASMPDLSAVKGNIEIELTPEGLRIQLLEDASGVFFETGSANPSARGREILALLGSELGKVSNPVLVEGYTDALPYPYSSTYTNWELSADRANTARRILTGHGLAPQQVSQIRGWADRQLRDPQHPTSPRNRRITITMLLTGDPQAGAPDSAAALSRPS